MDIENKGVLETCPSETAVAQLDYWLIRENIGGKLITPSSPTDAFVAKVRADGAGLVYCGYIGGGGEDRGSGIAVDSAGNAYVTGTTGSDQSTFPVAVGPDLSFNGNSEAFIVKIGEPATDADLLFTKTASPEPVTAGALLTYTLTLTNQGPSPAGSVTLTDTLPDRTTFVSCAAPGGGVCGGSGNDRTVSFASLAPGATASVSLTARIDCQAPDQAPIVNTAAVNSATPDPDTSNNSASAAVTASNPPPTITCPADVNASSDPGQTYATLSPGVPVATDAGGCQVMVTGARNDGRKLTDPYPVGTTAITWTATDAAGQTATCTQRITVRTLADLTVFKSSFSPTRPAVGEIFTYQVEVRNNGPSPAMGVVLTDLLPGEVVLISAAAGQGACSHSSEPRGVSCQLGAIGPAGSAVVLIRVRGLVSGLVINTVTAEPGPGLTTDPNLSNNTYSLYSRLQ